MIDEKFNINDDEDDDELKIMKNIVTVTVHAANDHMRMIGLIDSWKQV